MSRVLLNKESQKNILSLSKNKLGLTWKDLAVYLNVSGRALENWYLGRNLLPKEIFQKIIKISGENIETPYLLKDNWGAVKGGQNSVKLHGRSFWTLEGSRKGGINSAKKFPCPHYSCDLAEFIGIMLGDGGITENQISVTLGYPTDKEYVSYIRQLINNLFNCEISTYFPRDKNVVRIRISGVNLVKRLLVFGLVKGNKIKQYLIIPEWIFKSNDYMKACIRGLVDTDGCIHKNVRREKNGVEYRSVRIHFTSASSSLRQSVVRLLIDLGFKVGISNWIISISGKEQIEKYKKEIGFSNQKHLKRYKDFVKNFGWVKICPENCLKPLAKI